MTVTMITQPCPIWEAPPSLQEIDVSGSLCDSLRAGGRFQLMQKAVPLIQRLTEKQKACLSYWIFDHNRRYRLFDAQPDPVGPPVLDKSWVESHRDRVPPATDRLLAFLRELIHQHDTQETEETEDWDRLLAASGCQNDGELDEFWAYATDQGWIRTSRSMGDREWFLVSVDLAARMYIETQERTEGQGRQGFVAMWFDPSLNDAFAQGFKPAIEAAGYAPYRVDQDHFLGKVDDRIIAAIRQSRFVVADFTCGLEGARGGVYYEAGFAQGLGIPVIYTCRHDCFPQVHFDTNHINHLIWEDPGDLRSKLQVRIEATLGRGPVEGP